MALTRMVASAMAAAMCAWAVTASAQDAGTPEESAVDAAPVELTMWHHALDAGLEGAIVRQIVDDFNAAQDTWRVVFPERTDAAYAEAVADAAEAGELPDILDVEAADVAAWSGHFAPIDLPEDALAGLRPTAIGRVDGAIVSAGPWETALALIARRSVLEALDIRVPSVEEPWARGEFLAALTRIAATGDFDYPLDVGAAWGEGWYAHAVRPFVASAGGSVDAAGISAEPVRDVAAWWQGLFETRLAEGPEQTARQRLGGFVEGRYAMAWNGNWAVVAAVEEFGDDVVVLPPPDFGEGARTATSSWQFAVSATSEHPEGGAAFVAHALQPKYQQLFADGIGVLPASRAAAAGSIYYDEGSVMAPFLDIAEHFALPLSQDPAHAMAMEAFGEALGAIAEGADIDETLADVAAAIAPSEAEYAVTDE